MKRFAFLLICAILAGCKGPKGDKGDPGAMGLTGARGFSGTDGTNGEGVFTIRNGAIANDSQIVFSPKISKEAGLTVYVSPDNITFLPIPIYNVSAGYNIGYTVNNGYLIIANGYSGGMRYYNIVAITAAAPAYESSWQIGSKLLGD